MHSGPTNMRDTATDWKEIEECMEFIEQETPTHAEYVAWLEQRPYANVPLDASSFGSSLDGITFAVPTGSAQPS